MTQSLYNGSQNDVTKARNWANTSFLYYSAYLPLPGSARHPAGPKGLEPTFEDAQSFFYNSSSLSDSNFVSLQFPLAKNNWSHRFLRISPFIGAAPTPIFLVHKQFENDLRFLF